MRALELADGAVSPDAAAFHTAMLRALDEQRRRNEHTLAGLRRAFTVIVCGTLVGVCGLAIAAAGAS